MLIIVKIMVFMLMLAIINVCKEAFSFMVAWKKDESMGLTSKRKYILSVSIAYILTIIFTGFSF